MAVRGREGSDTAGSLADVGMVRQGKSQLRAEGVPFRLHRLPYDLVHLVL